MSPDPREAAIQAARLFRLPFRSRIWRGRTGGFAGAGSGSSIDFQEHRAYFPGDDPRHLDWRAYARSGQLLMKVFREEVSPAVDLVVDASGSMVVAREKERRTLELAAFVIESARSNGCAAAAWALGPEGPSPLATLDSLAPRGSAPLGPLLDRVPLRPGSLRVLVTDVLFPDPPEPLARRLASARGRGVVLAPSIRAESDPDWLGPVELEDCETGALRLERMTERHLEDYRARYRDHFVSWERVCRRYGIAFARIPAEEDLPESLLREALPAGAVEASG